MKIISYVMSVFLLISPAIAGDEDGDDYWSQAKKYVEEIPDKYIAGGMLASGAGLLFLGASAARKGKLNKAAAAGSTGFVLLVMGGLGWMISSDDKKKPSF
ncbi:MAG: hypothetical protein ACPGXY_01875 [Alphaproteobacteria bacterium]